MAGISAQHVKKTLDFVLDISALRDAGSFARHVVNGLPRLVASELTTLSICDLASGVRRVVSFPENAISVPDQQSFNRLMHQHPLVQYHSRHPGSGAWRISDSLSMNAFQRREIHADYYRRIGIDHVIAVPLVSNSRLVMSFVLNRAGRDFADGERDLLNRMQPALANLYRVASMVARCKVERESPRESLTARLTPREREILWWVAAGKSDAQIAGILGLSPRTVQKHLENSYVKLGVENRTAAAMIAIETPYSPGEPGLSGMAADVGSLQFPAGELLFTPVRGEPVEPHLR